MFNTVIVGADDSPTARRAVDAAAGVCAQFGSALHIVSAYHSTHLPASQLPGEFKSLTSPSDADALLQELEFIARRHDIVVSTHGVENHPVDAILETARSLEADLIVVGNRGMKGARRVLGSVPNSIAHGADCSVLIVDTTE